MPIAESVVAASVALAAVDISILSGMSPILIPAYTLLDEVNAVSGNGSLGRNVDNCTAMWGRPPNFLLVDYYNYGNFNGSVFQVAATANNVTYNQNQCCGTVARNMGSSVRIGFMDWRYLTSFLLVIVLFTKSY